MPLTLDQAAKELGICRRSLTAWLDKFPYCERRGIRKVFYPEHIDALREAIDRCSRSQPILKPASFRLAGPSNEGAKELERARAHLTEKRKRDAAATKKAMNMPDTAVASALTHEMRDAVDYAALPVGPEKKRASRPHSLTLRALERRGMIATNAPAGEVALTRRGRRILQMLRDEAPTL